MSSSDAQKIPLHIRAADGGTEVFLVDSTLTRIGKGTGELRVEVRPGIYKVRYRSGAMMEDQLIEVPSVLPRDKPALVVDAEPLAFDSPMPLPGTASAHEYQTDALALASAKPQWSSGSGGWLFVLCRDPEKRPGLPSRHRPWLGLSLRDSLGRLLLDFEDAPVRETDCGYAALTAEVTPGTYLLRVQSPVTGVFEMPVRVCLGWQTQVFLASRSESRRRAIPNATEDASPRSAVDSSRRVDLANAAVHMRRPYSPIDPASEALRLTELARLGLAQRRCTVRVDELERLVVSGCEDPMFGLLGANVLLACDAPSQEFLSRLLNSLEKLVPDHTDTDALRLAITDSRSVDDGGNSHAPEFVEPPMLFASWRRVLAASSVRAGTVPEGSLSALVAEGLLRGGSWLTWKRTQSLARALDARRRRLEMPEPHTTIAELKDAAPRSLRRAGKFSLDQAPPPCSTFEIDGASSSARNADKGALRSSDSASTLIGVVAQRYRLGGTKSPRLPDNLAAAEYALLSQIDAAVRRKEPPTLGAVVTALGMPPATVDDLVDKLLRRR